VNVDAIQGKVHGGQEDHETTSREIFVLVDRPTRENVMSVGLKVLMTQPGHCLGESIFFE
jgi:hypothetical protein